MNVFYICKIDNSHFVMYMGTMHLLWQKWCLQIFQLKLNCYKTNTNAFFIIGGDFNDASDDLIDRIPTRTGHHRFKASNFIIQKFATVDVWRFLNPDVRDYTWLNNSSSMRSRIDLWLLSSNCVQYVTKSTISHAPLSDHKTISLNLNGSKNSTNKSIRGYWKFNNTLLTDNDFNEAVKQHAVEIFKGDDLNPRYFTSSTLLILQLFA